MSALVQQKNTTTTKGKDANNFLAKHEANKHGFSILELQNSWTLFEPHNKNTTTENKQDKLSVEKR